MQRSPRRCGSRRPLARTSPPTGAAALLLFNLNCQMFWPDVMRALRCATSRRRPVHHTNPSRFRHPRYAPSERWTRRATMDSGSAMLARRRRRKRSETFTDHYSQATLLWQSQTVAEQQHIVEALQFESGKLTVPAVRMGMSFNLVNVDRILASRVATVLGVAVPRGAGRGRWNGHRGRSHRHDAVDRLRCGLRARRHRQRSNPERTCRSGRGPRGNHCPGACPSFRPVRQISATGSAQYPSARPVPRRGSFAP